MGNRGAQSFGTKKTVIGIGVSWSSPTSITQFPISVFKLAGPPEGLFLLAAFFMGVIL